MLRHVPVSCYAIPLYLLRHTPVSYCATSRYHATPCPCTMLRVAYAMSGTEYGVPACCDSQAEAARVRCGAEGSRSAGA
eukprot:3522078-Rhodomonas_salina.1